jgi:hypothetical protein
MEKSKETYKQIDIMEFLPSHFSVWKTTFSHVFLFLDCKLLKLSSLPRRVRMLEVRMSRTHKGFQRKTCPPGKGRRV